HHFVRVRAVSRDPSGKTVGALAIPVHEPLRRHRLARSQRVEQITITLCAPRARAVMRASFDRHLCTHVTSPPSVSFRIDLSRRLLCETGRFYPTLVGSEPTPPCGG